MRRVTLRDIAQEVGRSPATVSRVLTGRGDSLVSAETRRAILDAARRLGYSPNLAARALVTGRSYCIALWTETLADFHSIVANQLMDVLRPSRYEMVITDVVKHPDWHAYFQRSAPWPVDGIVVVDSPQSVEAYLEAARGRTTPIVSVGAYYSEKTDYVAVDLSVGVREAVHHLAEQGYRRIAHLTCRHGMRPGDARRTAYERTMVELGLPAEIIIAEESSREHALSMIRDLLRGPFTAEALVCFNDEMAIGAYRAVCEAGLKVPDDVAITGCDGIPDTRYFPCRITTIEQPVETICRIAWECLMRRLDDPGLPRQRNIIPARLVVRESSLRRSQQ